MKSRQFLSVIFSLIMFTGVTAGNIAFAESDDIDEILEIYCEMTLVERSDILSKYDLDDYTEKLAFICNIEYDDERQSSLYDIIQTIELEVIDRTGEEDETEDESNEVIDNFEDCVEAGYLVIRSFPEQCATDDGKVFTNTEDDDDDYNDDYDDNEDRFDLDDLLDEYCELSDIKKRQLLTDHPRLAPFTERLANYCDMSEDEQEAIDELIEEHGDKIRTELKDYSDEYRMDYKKDMRGHLDRYCEMTDEDKRAFVIEHDKAEDHVEKMNRYCTLDESDRMNFIEEHKDEYMKHMKDKMHDKMSDKPHMDYDRLCTMTESDRAEEITDVAKLDRLSKWCEMTPEERKDYKMKHHDGMDKSHMDKKQGHIDYDRLCDLTDSERADKIDDSEKLDRISKWCEMSTDEREDYKKEHHGEMKDKMHDKMSDKMHGKMTDKKHMDYDRLCTMTESDRAEEITDVAKLDRINDWCEMSPEEREDYKKEHHGEMKDKMHDKMSDKVHDKKHEMKLSDKSDRIKAMIMDKRDISDEKREEIKMKYIEKHGDLTDKKKSELKMKFKNHMASMKVSMSEDRRSEIHDRLAEMKAYKAELRANSSDLTDEEKQELREEFIEQAKDLQLAWITPRTQMTAGIVAADVECREGFSLVMKASNGVAMCLKADTALKMIDRGIVVPAN